jgi:hypothetical protein
VRHRPVIAAITAVLVLSGCGEVTGALGDGDGRAPGAATVTCGSSIYDPAELADAPTASSLPEGPADAVDDAGQPALDAPQDWTVGVSASPELDYVQLLHLR